MLGANRGGGSATVSSSKNRTSRTNRQPITGSSPTPIGSRRYRPIRVRVSSTLAIPFAGSAVITAAQRPELVSGLVVAGPFVRNPAVSTARRILLRAAMARPWAGLPWKSSLRKLYAGRRPADFGEYRDRVVASLGRPGYARAFSLTTRTSHAPAEGRLGAGAAR